MREAALSMDVVIESAVGVKMLMPVLIRLEVRERPTHPLIISGVLIDFQNNLPENDSANSATVGKASRGRAPKPRHRQSQQAQGAGGVPKACWHSRWPQPQMGSKHTQPHPVTRHWAESTSMEWELRTWVQAKQGVPASTTSLGARDCFG